MYMTRLYDQFIFYILYVSYRKQFQYACMISSTIYAIIYSMKAWVNIIMNINTVLRSGIL